MPPVLFDNLHDLGEHSHLKPMLPHEQTKQRIKRSQIHGAAVLTDYAALQHLPMQPSSWLRARPPFGALALESFDKLAAKQRRTLDHDDIFSCGLRSQRGAKSGECRTANEQVVVMTHLAAPPSQQRPNR